MASKRGSGFGSGSPPRPGAKRQRQHGKIPFFPPSSGQTTEPPSSSSLQRHPDPAAHPVLQQPHPPLQPDQQAATSPNSSRLPPLPDVFAELFFALCEKAASCFTPLTVAWLQDHQYLTFVPPPQSHDLQYPPSPAPVIVDSQQIIRLADAFGNAVSVWPESVPPQASEGHLMGLLHRASTTMLDALLKAATLHMVNNPDYLLPSIVWQEFMIRYAASTSFDTSRRAQLITGINQAGNFGDGFPEAELKMCLWNLQQDRTPRLTVSPVVLDKWRNDAMLRVLGHQQH